MSNFSKLEASVTKARSCFDLYFCGGRGNCESDGDEYWCACPPGFENNKCFTAAEEDLFTLNQNLACFSLLYLVFGFLSYLLLVTVILFRMQHLMKDEMIAAKMDYLKAVFFPIALLAKVIMVIFGLIPKVIALFWCHIGFGEAAVRPTAPPSGINKETDGKPNSLMNDNVATLNIDSKSSSQNVN